MWANVEDITRTVWGLLPEITVGLKFSRLSQFWWRVGGGCDTPGGLGVRDLGVR